MMNFLSHLQWWLRDLIKIEFLGKTITTDEVSVLIGFIITMVLSFIMWRRWKKEMDVLIDFYISLLSGLLLCGLIYSLFILYMIENKKEIPEFLKGGMSIVWTLSLGISFFFILFRYPPKFLDFLDHIFPFLAFLLGWSKGLHCFVFGCCYGKPTELPWGVVFHPQSPAGKAFPGIPLHPVQLYNTIGAWIIIPPALWLLKRKHFDGEVMLWMLFYMGLTKTFEFPYFRGDLPSPMRIWFISIPTMVITLFFLLISYYKYLSKKETFSSFK
jgi:phosphatidylglycerol:prolipoprotein diacylglycerol transferase